MTLEEHRRYASQTLGAYCLTGPEMVGLLDEIARLKEHVATLQALRELDRVMIAELRGLEPKP